MSTLVSRVRTTFRDPNPILVKELRTLLRSKVFIRFLYLSVAFIALIVLSTGATQRGFSMAPAEIGKMVSGSFFWVASVILNLAAPAYAATLITGERDKSTYESLLLTGMSPRRIVMGKFLAAVGLFSLVIAALAPIVGIAFLFGGVSPFDTLLMFGGLILQLMLAIATGIALSANLRSTRAAIIVAIFIYPSIAFMFAGAMWTYYLATTFGGASSPFISTTSGIEEAFLTYLLPVSAVFLIIWYMLASAMVSLATPSEDRSGPLKRWSLVAVPYVSIVLVWANRFTDASDAEEVGVITLGGFAFFLLAVVQTFYSEPPLPPRAWLRTHAEQRGIRKALGTLFGAGGMATARFATVLVWSSVLVTAIGLALVRHIVHPGIDSANHLAADGALIVMTLGHFIMGFWVVHLGAWVRSYVPHPIAVRALTGLLVATALFFPLFAQALFDIDGLENIDDGDVPLLPQLSATLYGIVALMHADREGPAYTTLILSAVVYGGLALATFFALAARVRSLKSTISLRRTAWQARYDAATAPSVDAPPTDPVVAAALGTTPSVPPPARESGSESGSESAPRVPPEE